MFTTEEQKKEIDGVGVCAGLERGWCIVWYATWLPLGLDLYSHRTREGGRKAEGVNVAVSAEAELSRVCWPWQA